MPSPPHLESPIENSPGEHWSALQPENATDYLNMPSVDTTSSSWFENNGSPQAYNNAETTPDTEGFTDSLQNGSFEPYMGKTDFSVDLTLPYESGGGILDTKTSNLLPLSAFIPYVQLFFERLYPVFPVMDKATIMDLLLSVDDESQQLPAGFYSFLASLSAAVIVQLNDTRLEPAQSLTSNFEAGVSLPPIFSAQFFVLQSLQLRQENGFIEDANEWTILTSFFLFAYYGNLDQSRSAWYYLREAISFAQILGLDDMNCYLGLDSKTHQRRQRLFWLLFVTERFFIHSPSSAF
jgi:hypothetical protein